MMEEAMAELATILFFLLFSFTLFLTQVTLVFAFEAIAIGLPIICPRETTTSSSYYTPQKTEKNK